MVLTIMTLPDKDIGSLANNLHHPSPNDLFLDSWINQNDSPIGSPHDTKRTIILISSGIQEKIKTLTRTLPRNIWGRWTLVVTRKGFLWSTYWGIFSASDTLDTTTSWKSGLFQMLAPRTFVSITFNIWDKKHPCITWLPTILFSLVYFALPYVIYSYRILTDNLIYSQIRIIS